VWDRLEPLKKNFYHEKDSVSCMSKEEVDQFYLKHQIIIKGERCPRPVQRFCEAGFSDGVMQTIAKQGWSNPTPIQSQGWPIALSVKNVVGIAQTGSGKTLSFMLPAIVHINNQAYLDR
jgi:superfamily II DNA/RNA helicase